MDRRTRAEREARAGQLFLFPPDPADRPAAAPAPPEPARARPHLLRRTFDELNRRFFDGALEARVEWSDRMTSSAGSCNRRLRLLRISAPYHRKRPDLLAATVAHEMLHLLIPNHGPAFRREGRRIAVALGVSWREFRYAQLWADPTRYGYVYRCPGCGREKPSRKALRASCGYCSRGGFDPRFRLVLSESRVRPGPVLLGERPVRTGRAP